jgi:hypothetical protein
VSSMPRRELDSHSVTPATYTVARKFRRSDKFAHQLGKSPDQGGGRGFKELFPTKSKRVPRRDDVNARTGWKPDRNAHCGSLASHIEDFGGQTRLGVVMCALGQS